MNCKDLSWPAGNMDGECQLSADADQSICLASYSTLWLIFSFLGNLHPFSFLFLHKKSFEEITRKLDSRKRRLMRMMMMSGTRISLIQTPWRMRKRLMWKG